MDSVSECGFAPASGFMAMLAAQVIWLYAKVIAILPSCAKCPLHSDAMFKMRVGVLLFSGSSIFIFILNKLVSIFLCHCCQVKLLRSCYRNDHKRYNLWWSCAARLAVLILDAEPLAWMRKCERALSGARGADSKRWWPTCNVSLHYHKVLNFVYHLR